MQFPRVFSVLSFFFAYTLLFVAASPIESDKAVVAKRSTESEVIAILTPLHTNAVAKAVEISARSLALLRERIRSLTLRLQRPSLRLETPTRLRECLPQV